MGWLCYNSTELYSNGKVNRKKEMDKISTWDSEHSSGRVLKSTMYGRVYYAALEVTNDLSDYRYVICSVCLTCGKRRGDSHGFNFGYKPMDERMGPAYYDCPDSILDLLTPTNDTEANDWRDICRMMNKRKRLLADSKQVQASFNYDICWPSGTRLDKGTINEFQKIRRGEKRKKVLWALVQDGKQCDICLDNQTIRYADLLEPA